MWWGSSSEAIVEGLFLASVLERVMMSWRLLRVLARGGAGREACALALRRASPIRSIPSMGKGDVVLVESKRAFRGRAERRSRHERHIEEDGFRVRMFRGRMVAMLRTRVY